MHKPIRIDSIGVFFPQKVCFDKFSATVNFGDRIGIIGKNGVGKSLLLKILAKEIEAYDGLIDMPKNTVISYVPQIIDNNDGLSGAERFNQCLSQALALSPDILLLDEPTNHLDQKNRTSLLRMLKKFKSTLIIVSHDSAVLKELIDTIWHVERGVITIFKGNYEEYLCENRLKKELMEKKVHLFNLEKKNLHASLMKEQERASKSKAKGKKSIEQKKWPTVISNAKANKAAQTAGKKKNEIFNKREEIQEQLSAIYIPKQIKPKFFLNNKKTEGFVVCVKNGKIFYHDGPVIFENLNFNIGAQEQVGIFADNASGKTSLIKAIMSHNKVIKEGFFSVPKHGEIAFVDQHYGNLSSNLTVFESLKDVVNDWDYEKLRQHLNDFLFSKNEEINNKVQNLSGGEKARLSLALAAAKVPKLLILDEITNNLDLETKGHVADVLRDYPGSMLLISHEKNFLMGLKLKTMYTIDNKNLEQIDFSAGC